MANLISPAFWECESFNDRFLASFRGQRVSLQIWAKAVQQLEKMKAPQPSLAREFGPFEEAEVASNDTWESGPPYGNKMILKASERSQAGKSS